MALETVLNLNLSAILSEAVDLGTRRAEVAKKIQKTLANGTGANQASKVYQDSQQLAGAGTTSLDLDAGSLLGPFGTAIAAFAAIRMILIEAPATNPDDIEIAGDFVTTAVIGGVTDDPVTLNLKPGGAILLFAPAAAGYPVTASSGDALSITNAHATLAADFSILVIGS